MVVDREAADMAGQRASSALLLDHHGDWASFDAVAEPDAAPASEASALEALTHELMIHQRRIGPG